MAAEMDLGVRRTLLAHERTLMAWIRTATSLISFGFTIYKFFEYLKESDSRPAETFFGPRELALGMIGVGMAALAVATMDYRQARKTLGSSYCGEYHSLAGALALVVFIIGLALLIVVLLHK